MEHFEAVLATINLPKTGLEVLKFKKPVTDEFIFIIKKILLNNYQHDQKKHFVIKKIGCVK